MKIPALILMVTEDCNFNCKYCYQTRKNHYMTWETAKQTLDFFLPVMKKNSRITFLGGEPFLAFDLVKEVVSYLESINRDSPGLVKYAASTNGSLLDDRVLDFLDQNAFTIGLSFDGYAQNRGRRKNSFAKTAATIKRAAELRHISLETNSTFTPATAASIVKSMELIMGLGVKKISLSLDLTKRWNRPSIKKLAGEIADLRKLVLRHYLKNKTIPVKLFAENKEQGIWQCPAGSNNLCVTPDGKVWGCPCFYEYFKGSEATQDYKKYYFGELGEFIRDFKKRYREIALNYSRFTMDNYYTSNSRCFLCPLVDRCEVCPVTVSASNFPLFYVPPYICEINKILIRGQEQFKKEVLSLNSS